MKNIAMIAVTVMAQPAPIAVQQAIRIMTKFIQIELFSYFILKLYNYD